jgi:hypothetical protein
MSKFTIGFNFSEILYWTSKKDSGPSEFKCGVHIGFTEPFVRNIPF